MKISIFSVFNDLFFGLWKYYFVVFFTLVISDCQDGWYIDILKFVLSRLNY